ncbi:transcriptional regulator [Rhodoplanes elegans]|uniref:Transcriptional regulator n=1 Tax=Rhodoplanes elegans TaxID=29408 RepID=A0A327KLR1_9BRAD|nr:helix-turn-helix domain-containing protein [Rhodoplanes elegans]MBK5956690.1 transcriptional regulator [Rhodoplanes elegans]RAI39201.1 transcriptional regulator [Rhodoplanes elegans]
MTTLEQKIASLPKARQAKIKARADALVAEEMALRELREAHAKTQAKVARTLGIGQDSVSRLEQRSDMLISTLRDYVAAIGGTMRLVVEFKGRPPVELNGFGVLNKPRRVKAAAAKTVRRPRRKQTAA